MAKKPKKKKKPYNVHKIYESKGGSVTRKNTFCPKCGKGIYMAKHKDRATCGKCGYTEFLKKEKK